MKKFKFRISQKIMGGFLVLLFIFILNAALGMFTLSKSATIIRETSDIVDPSKDALNEFNLLVTNSRMYITNWVYLRANTEDKEALKKIHRTDYPHLREQINELKVNWSVEQQNKISTVFNKFDTLLAVQHHRSRRI